MARELSPFSARRLLTQQLAEGENGNPTHGVRNTQSKEPVSKNGLEQTQKESLGTPRHQRRSRSRDSRSKDHGSDGRGRDVGKFATGAREASPEPCGKARDASQDGRRKRHHSQDRQRDRSKDRSRDRRRNVSSGNDRSRSRDRRRHRSRQRSKDRRRDRAKDGKHDRVEKRVTSGERRKRRHRSRSKERRPRENSPSSRPSHSPLPYRSRKPQTRSASASRSPPPKRRRRTRSPSRSRSPHQRAKKSLPSQEVSFRGLDDSAQPPSKYGGAPPNKEKPNFKATGMLAKHANRVEGTKISLKYHEPAEARKPPSSQAWRMFVFKGDDVVDTIELWLRSCWLFGRSHEVVDYALEHPSSSGQHAVIQFRYIEKIIEDEFGVKLKRGKVKPYIIDLESSNGTELNGVDVEASRYLELRDKDIVKFAGSEREYVIMLPPPAEK